MTELLQKFPFAEETKKKTIDVEMIASDFNGWVDINALATVKYWEQPKNNFGLAVDIFDQDDNQLDAKEHFHLQNCEAGKSDAFHALANALTPFMKTKHE